RRWLGGLAVADRWTVVVVPGAGVVNGADVAGVNPLDRLDDGRERSPLRAKLHDALVFAGSGDGQLALARVVARRLLDIHVVARAAAENRSGRMPRVRGVAR